MSETKTGEEVVAQARDNSLDNTNPVTTRQIVAQAVGIVTAVLIYKGFLEPSEGAVVGAQTDIIVGAILVLAGIVGSVAGRMKAYSPKKAASIAVRNAALPAGAPPTLAPPP